MLGDGTLQTSIFDLKTLSFVPAANASFKQLVETAIYNSFYVNIYELVAKAAVSGVNLPDYALEGGFFHGRPLNIKNLNEMLFLTKPQKIARLITLTGSASSTNYGMMALLVSKMVSYGLTFDDILGGDEFIVNSLGGNLNMAFAAYLVLGNLTITELTNKLNWLINPNVNINVTPLTFTSMISNDRDSHLDNHHHNKPIVENVLNILTSANTNTTLLNVLLNSNGDPASPTDIVNTIKLAVAYCTTVIGAVKLTSNLEGMLVIDSHLKVVALLNKLDTESPTAIALKTFNNTVYVAVHTIIGTACFGVGGNADIITAIETVPVNILAISFVNNLVKVGSTNALATATLGILVNAMFNFSYNGVDSNNVPQFINGQALTMFNKVLFNNLRGLGVPSTKTLSPIEQLQQSTIKKLMQFYNNVNNNVINYIYHNVENNTYTPLGMWAKYVNLDYLSYTDNTKLTSNYDVDDILRTVQVVYIYDYSSGKIIETINVQIFTAEELVQAGIVSINQLPEYISYVSQSDTGAMSSLSANLALVANVCNAMDQSSNSQSYTHIVYMALGDAVNYNDANGLARVVQLTNDQQNDMFAAIITNGVFDISKLAVLSSINGMLFGDVYALINYVLNQFNPNGSPKNLINPYAN